MLVISNLAAGNRTRSAKAFEKFKVNNEQEFVIAGYRPDGKNFDALLVGYYQGKELMFAGKIKAGFAGHPGISLERIQTIEPLAKCPFVNLPNSKKGRLNECITAEDMAALRWLRPKLVAQIAFTEWTRDDNLRHSKFVALRNDKDPKEVVRE